MATHAPTIAFAGIDCLDIDVQVQIASGFVGFTKVGPITPPRHPANLGVCLTAFAVTFMLGGCAFGSIDDLRLGTVELVQRTEHQEYELVEQRAQPNEFFLKVAINTSVDLSRIEDAFSVGEVSFFCDRPSENNHLGRSLFWNGKKIPLSIDPKTRKPGLLPNKPPFEYYTLIRVADAAQGYSKPPLASFNLKAKPEDVCIQFEVGPYRALGYKSNVVRVPASAITEALKDIPANHPFLPVPKP